MVIESMRTRKVLLKIISVVIVQSFVLSSIAFAVPAGTESETAASKEGVTDPEKIIIPRDCGLVKSKFTGKSGMLIVHIQDAHCNFEAQSNIAKIIETLIKNDNLSFVSVEGADGLIDTSWFKSFPDAEVRKEVASYFMKKGEITGPEFLSITTDLPIKLFGAETREYYIENLNAFTSSYPLKEQTEKYFNQIKSLLNTLKGYIYNEDLRAMDAKAAEYESKKLPFNDYIRFLQAEAEKYRINLREYDNLFKLINVLVYEKKIDFDVTDKERSALIDDLSKRITKDVLTELVNQSIAFKVGKVSSAEYYVYVRNLATRNGIDLMKDYPNLYNYIIYNSVYSKIENEELFKEIKKLETAIKEKLFQNDDQRTLEKLSRHIDTLLGLVSIKLLNDDFEYYKTHKEEFTHEAFGSFIKDKIIQYGLAYELDEPSDTVADAVSKLEEFYYIAIKRDKALVENTLNGMEKAGQKIAVLVTGGFHSEGIAKLLEKQDVSYIVVCPSITKDVPTNYIQILTNQRTPFEEILVGAPQDTKQGMLAPLPATYGVAFEQADPEGFEQVYGPYLKGRMDRFIEEAVYLQVKLWLQKKIKYASEQHIPHDRDFMSNAYKVACENLAATLNVEPEVRKTRIDAIMSSSPFKRAFNETYALAAQAPEIGIVQPADEYFSGGAQVDWAEWERVNGFMMRNRGNPSVVAYKNNGKWDIAAGGVSMPDLAEPDRAGQKRLGWDAVKDSPQIKVENIGQFIAEVYATLNQIYEGTVEAYSLTNIKQMNEESPDLYARADAELLRISKGRIRPVLAVEDSEERKHDFPAFTNNMLRMYFELNKAALEKMGIARYEDFLMKKVPSLTDDEWAAFYKQMLNEIVVVITDGGLKTRAGNETLGRLHSGLWTFVRGLDARMLNLIVDLTMLKMMPKELRDQVLIWSASDNYTWLGKSNLPELLQDPAIAGKFAVLTSGSRVQLIDTATELQMLDQAVQEISGKSDLKEAWNTIMANEALRKKLSDVLNSEGLAKIRQRIKAENLQELGIYTAYPKGHRRAYEMSGFWEKCKDDLKIIQIAHLNEDKGSLYKNPFGEILHKEFAVKVTKEFSRRNSKTLARYNLDYCGLDALPVSYMTVAYQSRFCDMKTWEGMVPTVEIAGEKGKIDLDDWRELKKVFDNLFDIEKEDRTRLYCFDFGEGHIWQDTGHLTPVHQLFEYIAFNPEGRMSMQIPKESNQNLINTNLEVGKNLIVKNRNAVYLIDNVRVIGGGSIEIPEDSDRIVMSNVAIYVPKGKVWRVPPRTHVLDAAFRWDRVTFSRGAYKRGYIRISNFFPEVSTTSINVRSDENVNTVRIGTPGGGYNVMISRSSIFLPFKFDKGIKAMINDYLSDMGRWAVLLDVYPNINDTLGWYLANGAGIPNEVRKDGVKALPLHLSALSDTAKDNIAEVVYNALRDEHSDILLDPELVWSKVKNVPGGFFSLPNPGLGGFTFSQAQKRINYKRTDERRRKNLMDLDAASRGDYSMLEKYFGSWAPQSELIASGAVGAIRGAGGALTEAEHGTRGLTAGTINEDERSANAALGARFRARDSVYTLYLAKQPDLSGPGEIDIPFSAPTQQLSEIQERNLSKLMAELPAINIGVVIVKGLTKELEKREVATDMVFHPGIGRRVAYLDEEDLLYLLSLPDGVGKIVQALRHEKAHIENRKLSEAQIEAKWSTYDVRKALLMRDGMSELEANFKLAIDGLPQAYKTIVAMPKQDLIKYFESNLSETTAKLPEDIFGFGNGYDVRGNAQPIKVMGKTIEANLTPANMYLVGKLLGTYHAKPGDKALLTGDIRLHTPISRYCMALGISSVGVNVEYAPDLLTTGAHNLMATENSGGYKFMVQVSGSHGPKEKNGFKIKVDLGNKVLEPLYAEKLADLYKQRSVVRTDVPAGSVTQTGGIEQYVVNMLNETLPATLKDEIVVIDPRAGAAGPIITALLEKRGFKIIDMDKTKEPDLIAAIKKEWDGGARRIAVMLNMAPDGNMGRGIWDPSLPEALEPTQRLVKLINANPVSPITPRAFGAVFDGDADRISAIDETGRAIPAFEMTLPYYQRFLINPSNQEVMMRLVQTGAEPIRIVCDVRANSKLLNLINTINAQLQAGAGITDRNIIEGYFITTGYPPQLGFMQNRIAELEKFVAGKPELRNDAAFMKNFDNLKRTYFTAEASGHNFFHISKAYPSRVCDCAISGFVTLMNIRETISRYEAPALKLQPGKERYELAELFDKFPPAYSSREVTADIPNAIKIATAKKIGAWMKERFKNDLKAYSDAKKENDYTIQPKDDGFVTVSGFKIQLKDGRTALVRWSNTSEKLTTIFEGRTPADLVSITEEVTERLRQEGAVNVAPLDKEIARLKGLEAQTPEEVKPETAEPAYDEEAGQTPQPSVPALPAPGELSGIGIGASTEPPARTPAEAGRLAALRKEADDDAAALRNTIGPMWFDKSIADNTKIILLYDTAIDPAAQQVVQKVGVVINKYLGGSVTEFRGKGTNLLDQDTEDQINEIIKDAEKSGKKLAIVAATGNDTFSAIETRLKPIIKRVNDAMKAKSDEKRKNVLDGPMSAIIKVEKPMSPTALYNILLNIGFNRDPDKILMALNRAGRNSNGEMFTKDDLVKMLLEGLASITPANLNDAHAKYEAELAALRSM